jgi:hypothetical protein
MINSKIKSLLEFQYQKDLNSPKEKLGSMDSEKFVPPSSPKTTFGATINIHNMISNSQFTGKIILKEPEYYTDYKAWSTLVDVVNGDTRRIFYSTKDSEWQWF